MESTQHLDEDILERYAMNVLSDGEAESVEDHTSLCTQCLDRLDESSAYVTAMRSALQEQSLSSVREQSFLSRLRERFRLPTPVWVAAAVAAAVVVLVEVRPAPLPAMATVMVSGTRGTSTVAHGTGPFDFKLFMPEAAARYGVQLIDRSGKELWRRDVPGHNGKLDAVVDRRIAPGQYFLRVTEPVSKSVHEYAVEIGR